MEPSFPTWTVVFLSLRSTRERSESASSGATFFDPLPPTPLETAEVEEESGSYAKGMSEVFNLSFSSTVRDSFE